VRTFAPYVQDSQQEIQHPLMHFVNCVQICVMLVPLNVENFQHMIAVKSAQKHAKNVLPNAAGWVKSNYLINLLRQRSYSILYVRKNKSHHQHGKVKNHVLRRLSLLGNAPDMVVRLDNISVLDFCNAL
jgi:Geminivirus V2 protein